MGRSDLQKLLDLKKTAKKHFFDECWPDLAARGARQATASRSPDLAARGARQATASRSPDLAARGARQATASRSPDPSGKEPLLIIFTTKEKSNRDLVFKLLEGVLVLPTQVVVVSEDQPGELMKHHTGKIFWFNPESGRNAPKLDQWMLAADMAVIFDEKQSTINTLFDKGVVPIAHEKSPLLENYHPNEETGNSFTYNEKNPWGVFAALVRACETYHFPYDWQHIIRGILKVR